jgi:hypothetical protein
MKYYDLKVFILISFIYFNEIYNMQDTKKDVYSIFNKYVFEKMLLNDDSCKGRFSDGAKKFHEENFNNFILRLEKINLKDIENNLNKSRNLKWECNGKEQLLYFAYRDICVMGPKFFPQTKKSIDSLVGSFLNGYEETFMYILCNTKYFFFYEFFKDQSFLNNDYSFKGIKWKNIDLFRKLCKCYISEKNENKKLCLQIKLVNNQLKKYLRRGKIEEMLQVFLVTDSNNNSYNEANKIEQIINENIIKWQMVFKNKENKEQIINENIIKWQMAIKNKENKEQITNKNIIKNYPGAVEGVIKKIKGFHITGGF